MRYRVFYNTHQYADCSDTARASSRIVESPDPDTARETIRGMQKCGSRYIGMIHDAEDCEVKPDYPYMLFIRAKVGGTMFVAHNLFLAEAEGKMQDYWYSEYRLQAREHLAEDVGNCEECCKEIENDAK